MLASFLAPLDEAHGDLSSGIWAATADKWRFENIHWESYHICPFVSVVTEYGGEEHTVKAGDSADFQSSKTTWHAAQGETGGALGREVDDDKCVCIQRILGTTSSTYPWNKSAECEPARSSKASKGHSTIRPGRSNSRKQSRTRPSSGEPRSKECQRNTKLPRSTTPWSPWQNANGLRLVSFWNEADNGMSSTHFKGTSSPPRYSAALFICTTHCIAFFCPSTFTRRRYCLSSVSLSCGRTLVNWESS
jgi:hypothetical protein